MSSISRQQILRKSTDSMDPWKIFLKLKGAMPFSLIQRPPHAQADPRP
jgi:hypothetical protein